jgi:predicted dinucleotide-binding enzyme
VVVDRRASAEGRKQGRDEKRVKELIAHYENQTEDEEFADIEAAREAADITLMAIPTELVPKVRALLAGK